MASKKKPKCLDCGETDFTFPEDWVSDKFCCDGCALRYLEKKDALLKEKEQEKHEWFEKYNRAVKENERQGNLLKEKDKEIQKLVQAGFALHGEKEKQLAEKDKRIQELEASEKEWEDLGARLGIKICDFGIEYGKKEKENATLRAKIAAGEKAAKEAMARLKEDGIEVSFKCCHEDEIQALRKERDTWKETADNVLAQANRRREELRKAEKERDELKDQLKQYEDTHEEACKEMGRLTARIEKALKILYEDAEPCWRLEHIAIALRGEVEK